MPSSPPAVAELSRDMRWGCDRYSPNAVVVFPTACSMRQRIGPHLDMHGHRARALAQFVEPGRAIAARAPQATALPAGVRIVDAGVEPLRIIAHGVRHAHQDHLTVDQGGEAILEVRG